MLEQFRVVATPSRRNPTVNTYRYSPYEKRNDVPMTITAPKDNKEQSLCNEDNIDDQLTAALHEAVAVERLSGVILCLGNSTRMVH